jgi:N-acetylmuramoyl-L-alanine amidase
MFVFKKLYPFLLSTLLLISGLTYAQAPRKIKTIIVDPGHGGSDNGATGDYEGSLGSKEKNITLAISIRLVDELKKQMPDVNIIPTRTTDVYNSVKEKAQFANDNHGDLFVCIHADAVNLKTGYRIIGHHTETYYTTKYIGKGKKRKKVSTPHTHVVPTKEYYKIPTERKGTSTLILVARQSADKAKALENSDLPFETADNDSSVTINYDSPEWKASALIYSQRYFKKSYQLASDVQEEIADIGRDDLGVWQRQKGLWVLHATQMPAVLIETGFISNYSDERYLNSEKGQQEIAECITRALIKYRNQAEGKSTLNTDAMTTK